MQGWEVQQKKKEESGNHTQELLTLPTGVGETSKKRLVKKNKSMNT